MDAACQVRDEAGAGQNTARRVGELLLALADALDARVDPDRQPAALQLRRTSTGAELSLLDAAGLMTAADMQAVECLSARVLDLGEFATSGAAETAALQPAVSGDNGVALIRYTVPSAGAEGLLVQQVGARKTVQLLLWDGAPKMRHVYFTSTARTQIDPTYSTKFYWVWPTQLRYDAASRALDLSFFDSPFNGAATLPLATASQAGLMSTADKTVLNALAAAPAVLRPAPVAAWLEEMVMPEGVTMPAVLQVSASVVWCAPLDRFLWRVQDGLPALGEEQKYKYYILPSVGAPYVTAASDGTEAVTEGLLVRCAADGRLRVRFGGAWTALA